MNTPLSAEKRDSNIDSPDGSRSYRESKGARDDSYQVTLGPEDDPKNLPVWRKWLTVAILNAGAMNATGASSMVRIVALPSLLELINLIRPHLRK